MKNSREVAFDVLSKVFLEDAYSNLALDSAIKENNLSKLDSSFTTALVYGVLERCLTLDYIIRKLSTVPFRKIEKKTLIILRMAFYQLIFMDKVPDSAAVNEAVNMAKAQKLFKSSGFINGMLRGFIRNNKEYSLPPETDKVRYLSVKYSCPDYLIKLWHDAYGEEATIGILSSLSSRPPLSVFVNTTKVTRDELRSKFESEGVEAVESPLHSRTLYLSGSGAVDSLKAYRDGDFFVQDESSSICALLSGVKPGDTVYDVCSAPGGKTFAMAVMMENKGMIKAFDIHLHKVKLIEAGAYRLGLKIVKPAVRDAAADEKLTEKADVVLCDVPCSGFGILRRKPEIRYRKEDSFGALPELQLRILHNSAKLVREGGTLVYSTCTLNPAENSQVVERFLDSHPEYSMKEIKLPSGITRKIPEDKGMLTLFPEADKTDGFFIATMVKNAD